MKNWVIFRNPWLLSVAGLIVVLVLAWSVYGLFGHSLIERAYDGAWPALTSRLMSGRTSTSLESYLLQADDMMRLGTIWLLSLYVATLILIKTKLLGNVVLVISSFFVTSFLLFCTFEWFPSLIPVCHLDNIGYYSYKAGYVADEQLIYKQKPLTKTKAYRFRGDHYSPAFGIDVLPVDTDWETDRDGFRNSGKDSILADVVVIGDSYIDYGNDESDTFGKRLGRHLGRPVRNLGIAGYGPFQYLEVLKRYGIQSRPKVALFCFFEGNDLGDIHAYKRWKQFNVIDNGTIAMDFSRSFLGRYPMVLSAVTRFFKDAAIQAVQGAYMKLFASTKSSLHPDVAALDLTGATRVKKVLFGRIRSKSEEELRSSGEWTELRRILREFKQVCVEHQIVPTILFIPTDTHIYAKYSTLESGQNWLQLREDQINRKEIIEQSMAQLSDELQIALVSLCPVFDTQARSGRLVYDPLDTHWNSEGREVAASHVANLLEMEFALLTEAKTHKVSE